MIKFWQTEWHHIAFSDLGPISSRVIAGGSFYDRFYTEFFRRYHQWSDLDQAWLVEKETISDYIYKHVREHVANPNASVLSIGCGIGAVERKLVSHGKIRLEITETGATPLRWISVLVPQENIHLGFFPDCVPPTKKYDLIYLSAVDYVFDEKGLTMLLTSIKDRLNPGGTCLLVSGSFLEEEPGPFALTRATLRLSVGRLLDSVGVRPLGQLWGYMRTGEDYRRSMTSAGFVDIADGRIGGRTYFIKGNIT